MMMGGSARRLCSSESYAKLPNTTQTTDLITKGLASATLVLAGWTSKTMYDNHVGLVKTVDGLKDKFADSDKQTAVQLERLNAKVDNMVESIKRLEQALLPKKA